MNHYALLLKIKHHYDTFIINKLIGLKIVTRSLFKQRMMALAYGEGFHGCKDRFVDFIKEWFDKRGYSSYPVTEHQFNLWASNVTFFFRTLAAEKFPGIIEYTKMARKFIENNKNKINIDLPYLSWSFLLYQKIGTLSAIDENTQKSSSPRRVKIKDNYGHENRFSVWYTLGIDYEEMMSKFPSILIHSLDAYMVYDILNFLSGVNEKLSNLNLEPIQMAFNHDNFGINFLYAYFLMPIVRRSYNNLCNLNIPCFPNLFKKKNNKSKVMCIGTTFIKY